MTTEVINLISGPRNLSTALMYSFAQRTDTQVIDEPFYAHYLSVTGLNHPGKEEVLATMPSNPEVIVQQINDMTDTPYVFLKGMAHHLIEMNLHFLQSYKNLFLIRNPRQLIASFAEVIEQPTMQDIGLQMEWQLFEFLQETTKRQPVVLDTGELMKHPEEVLKKTCEALGIPYDANMLHWKAGGIPEDGVWKKYWYANVHKSTGFSKQSTSTRSLPPRYEALYEEALPYYEKLFDKSIKA